ncbi:MAG: iron ABC transporter permease [Gemmatimonadota bacterium]|nr:iron ABC transporter permease [Gemmatimonadota bacterium]
MIRSGKPFVLLGMVVALVAVSALAVSVGAAGISLGEVVDIFFGNGEEISRTIVLDLRLPRVAFAGLVGCGLALSGVVFQALLRNPLAEPYILGVAGGAAAGAVTALIFWGVAVSGIVLSGFAFAGAILSIVTVIAIATRVGRGLDTRVLLLTGVVIGAFFNSIILLLVNFTDAETFRAAMFWMMGSFSGATGKDVAFFAVYLLPIGVVLMLLARPLNLLAAGEQTAFYLGVNIQVLKLVSYFVASLIVAVSVAMSGAIGFVGLIVPHATRLVLGSDHRTLLPAAAVVGAIFMIVADTLARIVVQPTELPVGVVTALIGVPVFLVLLIKQAR